MLIGLIQKKFIRNPKTNNYLSSSLVKDAISLDDILLKNSLINFSVCQLYKTFSML